MPASASYAGLKPASPKASNAARGSSKKSNTKCELLLRRELWKQGCRFRVDVRTLPGRPDIVFTKARVAIFCDGDFWHGRNWDELQRKLAKGHNPDYWLKKISRNMERDKQATAALQLGGWTVLRFWEGDLLDAVAPALHAVLNVLDARGHRHSGPRSGIGVGPNRT